MQRLSLQNHRSIKRLWNFFTFFSTAARVSIWFINWFVRIRRENFEIKMNKSNSKKSLISFRDRLMARNLNIFVMFASASAVMLIMTMNWNFHAIVSTIINSATAIHWTIDRFFIVCCFRTAQLCLNLTIAMIEIVRQFCFNSCWVSITLFNCCFTSIKSNSLNNFSKIFVCQQIFLSTRYCIATMIKKLTFKFFRTNFFVFDVSNFCRFFNICHFSYWRRRVSFSLYLRTFFFHFWFNLTFFARTRSAAFFWRINSFWWIFFVVFSFRVHESNLKTTTFRETKSRLLNRKKTQYTNKTNSRFMNENFSKNVARFDFENTNTKFDFEGTDWSTNTKIDFEDTNWNTNANFDWSNSKWNNRNWSSALKRRFQFFNVRKIRKKNVNDFDANWSTWRSLRRIRNIISFDSNQVRIRF